MLRPLALGLAAALVLLAAGAPVRGDVIRLKNGGTLEGKVRDTSDGRIEILLPYGSLALETALVASVERSATVDDEVAARLRALAPDDAKGLYELARWCHDRSAYTLAGRLLEEVLAIDPDHAEARRELGFRRVGQEWLTEEEARARRGEVFFRGAWVSAEQRDRLLLLERAVAADNRRSDLEQARLEVELARLEAELARDFEPAATGYAAQTIYPGGAYSAGYYTGAGHRGSGAHPQGFSPAVRHELERREQRRAGPGATPAPTANPAPRHHRGGFLPP